MFRGMPPSELLTAPKAAELLHVSDETVRRWAADGKLPCVTLPSGRRVFRREDIDAILTPESAA